MPFDCFYLFSFFSYYLFKSVVDCGALDALVICLEEFDPGVKEAAAWALGYVAKHNTGSNKLLNINSVAWSITM